jgi:glycosyltransferase involved in cell wall biosynthesis
VSLRRRSRECENREIVHVTTTDMSLDWLLRPQLEAFAAAGYVVVGASAVTPGAGHVEALRDSGIEHVELGHLHRSMAPGADLRALRELHSLFRRRRPLVVHTHNPKPGVLGRLAARAAGVPVVVNTVHGLYAQPGDTLRRRAGVYALERIAATCSHVELVQNPEDVDTLVHTLHVPESRVTLLGNGVDLDRFDPAHLDPGARGQLRRELGVAPDEILCGVVGRLVWEKGYREVFAAAGELRRRAPRVRVVVIGPTEPGKADAVDPHAIVEAERAGVVFAGTRHDMEKCYAAMDLFVLASYREGFPRSAMEAAAMGLPVVMTDIRGGRQVVDHEVTGLLVAVGDAPALADAIARLAGDADQRVRYAAAARVKAVAEFDQQRVIDITLDAYARLTARAALTIRSSRPM